MNALAPIDDIASLPALIDRAASALSNARSSAEVLEAKEMASFAYDTAKRTARLAKAKNAHDELIGAAHRAQAHALEIEAQAKHRLADEYDAAQERGEVAIGRPKSVGDSDTFQATSRDLGLTRQQVHEARIIRDAEKAEPGFVRRVLDEKLEAREEPTKAALRQAANALVHEFGTIIVGDVSPKKLAKTRMAKSVYDAGWAGFKGLLLYKSMRNGGRVLEVSEAMSSQTCSTCGCLPASRPRGIAGLGVRRWTCSDCGTEHDRDVNAAMNIARAGLSTLAEGAVP